MTYGLMPNSDYKTMDATLEMVCRTFPEGIINTFEIGVHAGNTSRGIHNFLTNKGRLNFHTGIDNGHDLPITEPFPGCNIIIGNSIEVYNRIEDNSQHFGFIDGNHSYPMTMADHLVYSPKIRKGGYLSFHDTGRQIKPKTDWQGMGSREDPDMYISCRKAIEKLGLHVDGANWNLIFDDYDPNFHTGGIMVFQKLY